MSSVSEQERPPPNHCSEAAEPSPLRHLVELLTAAGSESGPEVTSPAAHAHIQPRFPLTACYSHMGEKPGSVCSRLLHLASRRKNWLTGGVSAPRSAPSPEDQGGEGQASCNPTAAGSLPWEQPCQTPGALSA
ncbi:6-phosphogluconolactonase [Platysternon megacephalum]|uniref:6-phosphogluconolactonase n=1 Tax=Platysternon megacephalum TaxID=55544 RepID=A0A4D9DCX8_9SAUR|nr:dihydrolipoamide succinyltransferase [Platysternon megacephalum]TFJ96261.1 6-phosphogluconolactonase [Platysternon megacephalum]